MRKQAANQHPAWGLAEKMSKKLHGALPKASFASVRAYRLSMALALSLDCFLADTDTKS